MYSLRFVSGAFLALIFLTGNSVVGQALMEQQTINENMNGRDGWVASFGTADEQVTNNNGVLSVGGQGGAGQFFGVNGKSRYQVAKCVAIKSGSWAGFGVTYYDFNWNEVSVQFKEIKADAENGDNARLYSIGLEPPPNAVFAYLWTWCDDSTGYVQIDNCKVLNYFPEGDASVDNSQPDGNKYTQTFPSQRNRLINGSFETQIRDDRSESFEADEFWNVVGTDNSVFYDRFSGSLGDTFGLRMGSKTETNMIYQTIRDVQPGQDYDLDIRYGRLDSAGSRPFLIAGVDFYDASGQKIGDVAKSLEKSWFAVRFGGPQLDSLTFAPPAGTANSVFWIWAPATGESDASYRITSVNVTPN